MIAEAPRPWQSSRRAVELGLALCLTVLLCGSVARAQSVAFINPGKSGEIYWVTATQGMQAAAHSLGMTFEVQYAQREPLKTLEIAREMVARPAGKRPEYIVVTDDYSVADRLLAIIDPAGVKTFLAYSSIPVDQRGGIGSPRGKYKGWLGSLEPQAEDAGYLTARALIERGKREKAFGPDGKLHMLAIAGDRSTPSSINRNQGMRRAVAEAPMVVLEEEVYAAWARENAAQQAESLYRRYPEVKLVWAGNDLMAFGAMAAWEKRGGKPGVDAWFSGVNTSTEALEAVKSGRLTSLAGGHFITGAWALVISTTTITAAISPTKGSSCGGRCSQSSRRCLPTATSSVSAAALMASTSAATARSRIRNSGATTSALRNCWSRSPEQRGGLDQSGALRFRVDQGPIVLLPRATGV
jgi:ABC-type sugar transport system substrate-binding protein